MADKRQSTRAGKTAPARNAQPSAGTAMARRQMTPPSIAPEIGNFLTNPAKR